MTFGWKFCASLPYVAGVTVLMKADGMQVSAPLAKYDRNGPKGFLNWSLKVVVSTTVALTKPNGSLAAVVGKAPRSPTVGSERKVKVSTQSWLVSAVPSDHFRPLLSLMVKVFRSLETSPLAMEGSSLAMPPSRVMLTFWSVFHSPAQSCCCAITPNVSALFQGSRESGSSSKISTTLPPALGCVPVVFVVDALGPQAASSESSASRAAVIAARCCHRFIVSPSSSTSCCRCCCG